MGADLACQTKVASWPPCFSVAEPAWGSFLAEIAVAAAAVALAAAVVAAVAAWPSSKQ